MFQYSLNSAGRGYSVQRSAPQGANAAQTVLGNTQNWAGLAGQTSASKAQRENAYAQFFDPDAAQAAISNVVNAGIEASTSVMNTGLAGATNLGVADKAILEAKVRRGPQPSQLGQILTPLVGLGGAAWLMASDS